MGIKIKDKAHWHQLRAKYIGASESAALFNASPYLTLFTLWQTKKHGLQIDETEPMMIGRHMEAGIAMAAAEKWNLSIHQPDEYFCNASSGIGATLDYMDDNGEPVEIKNVGSYSWSNYWQDGIPLHYRIQLQQQMGLTNTKAGTLIALAGGNELHMWREDFNPAFYEAILRKAESFWVSIEDNIEPSIETLLDAETAIKTLEPSNGDTVDMSDNSQFNALASEYLAVDSNIKLLKKLEEDARIIKSKMVKLIGPAKVGTGACGVKISRTVIPDTEVKASIRKGYTRVSVSYPKGEQ